MDNWYNVAKTCAGANWMPVYKSTEQLYTYLRILFDRIRALDGAATQKMAASRLLIRLTLDSPAGVVVINGRSQPIQITYGMASTQPDLDIQLPADTLHKILLGELTLKKALGSGQLKVKGQIWKTGALEPIFEQGKLIYPSVFQSSQ